MPDRTHPRRKGDRGRFSEGLEEDAGSSRRGRAAKAQHDRRWHWDGATGETEDETDLDS